MKVRLLAMMAAICVCAPSAYAQESPRRLTLTLPDALTMARQRAPGLIAARGAVETARAEVARVDVFSPYNPRFRANAGPRIDPRDGVTPNIQVGVMQTLELGGKGRARVDVARAEADVRQWQAKEVTRRVVAEVARAYVTAAHAQQRLRVAQRSLALAKASLDIATKRFAAGEIGNLDVNTARLAAGRREVDVQMWRGRLARHLGELKALIGADVQTSVALKTSLGDLEVPELQGMLRASERRPDIAAFDASLRAQEAQLVLADALETPNLGVGALYVREERADVMMGALTLTLPIFSFGQGIRARALAASRIVRDERAARLRRVQTELRAIYERYTTLRDARAQFLAEVLPTLEQNEAMSEKAYRSGAIDLPDLLAVRREIIDAREAYTDLLLEAALACVELQAISATLPNTQDTP